MWHMTQFLGSSCLANGVLLGGHVEIGADVCGGYGDSSVCKSWMWRNDWG